MTDKKIPPYYATMVKHCTRFYLDNLHKTADDFSDPTEKENFTAVKTALNTHSCNEQKNLLFILREGKIVDNIEMTAKLTGINAGSLWGLLRKFEREVAFYRGLITEREFKSALIDL